MKKVYQYILPLVLASGLLYWAFKDVSFSELTTSFKSANYPLVFLGLIIGFLAHASRGIRWGLMLNPLGYKPKIGNTTSAVLLGYLTNLVFPRAGEFARSVALQKSEDIPFEKSFGAVIAERIIDVITLLLLAVVNVILEFDRIKDLVLELIGDKLKSPQKIILVLGVFLIVGLFSFLIFKKYKKQILEINIIKKIFHFLSGLYEGFSGILKLKNPGLFVFHSLFIWAMYFLSTYILCLSVPLGENISFLATLTILVMGSIGMAAPTLGGLGSYHFLVGKIVVLYGLTASEGIGLATFLHTMQGIVYVVLLGLGGFLYTLLSKKTYIK